MSASHRLCSVFASEAGKTGAIVKHRGCVMRCDVMCAKTEKRRGRVNPNRPPSFSLSDLLATGLLGLQSAVNQAGRRTAVPCTVGAPRLLIPHCGVTPTRTRTPPFQNPQHLTASPCLDCVNVYRRRGDRETHTVILCDARRVGWSHAPEWGH